MLENSWVSCKLHDIWKKDVDVKANVTQSNTHNGERHIEPKLTQERYNKLMCLLSTHPNLDNDKEPSIVASAHLEGQYVFSS